MFKQFHTTFLVLLLLLGIVFLVGQYKQQIERQKHKVGSLDIEVSRLAENLQLIHKAWATGGTIPSAKGSGSYLEKLPGHPVLALRISDKQCSSCVDQVIFELSQFLDLFPSNQLVVLYTAQERSHLLLAHRLQLMKGVPFIEVAPHTMICPLDAWASPYLITLDNQGNMGASYLPYPSEENQLDTFLHHIADQFKTPFND